MQALNEKGEPCKAAPMVKSAYCVFHDPEHAEVVQQARSAGGQRRKREVAVAIAFEFEGPNSIAAIRRLVEVAAYDALGLPNDLPRVRALAYLAQVAVTLGGGVSSKSALPLSRPALGPRVVARRRG
jgi:hypothetical protein